MTRKVTKEIAEYIRNLHISGHGYKEIMKLVEHQYNVKLSDVAIYLYYRPYDEVKKYYKEKALSPEFKKRHRIYERRRYQRPDVKSKKIEWQKKYVSRPEIKKRVRIWKARYAKLIYHLPEYLTDLFSDGSEKSLNELSNDIFNLTKINVYPATLKKKIDLFSKSQTIPSIEEIEEGVYKLKNSSNSCS